MSIIEEINFARDSRNCARAEKPIVRIRLPGRVHLERLPFRFEVCGLCQGHGTHVNPSIDCNGLTADDFDRDPEFEEEYFNGTYDVTCNQCGGEKVVPVIDEEACEQSLRKRRALALYHGRARQERAHESQAFAERMAELRAGC